MTTILFALSISLALSALCYKKLTNWHQKTRAMQQPGYSPKSPCYVSRFDEIDSFIQTRRCPCGGTYKIQSEGGRQIGSQRLRVTRTECCHCENERDFFFVVNHAKKQIEEMTH